MPNSLSVRSQVPGMVAGEVVAVDGSPQDRSAPRLTILIHGYQNSEERAQQSYEAFEGALDRAGARRPALGAIWHFHWPSDHPRKLVSIITYAVRVPEARSAGRLLAEGFLATLSPHQEVTLVAHSLGCRVALEAVRTIRAAGAAYGGGRVRAVMLLAAAVPQLQCSDAPQPYPAALAGATEHVFHSRRDRALGLAFDLGQRLYGEAGDAVGREGRPTGRWDTTTDTGLQHSRYWSSRFVADEVAQLLGGPSSSRLAVRHLPQSGIERTELSRRAVSARRLPKRRH
jgi:pimeloyl-ACP methyl ester carboxylesterase